MKLSAAEGVPFVVTLTYDPFFQVHLVDVGALLGIVIDSNVQLLGHCIWKRTNLIQLNHFVIEKELGLAVRADLNLSIFIFFVGILLHNEQVVVLVLVGGLLMNVPFEHLAQIALPLRPALVRSPGLHLSDE